MSESDKAASIGKLMLEWRDSNEKMGAIEAEFLRHSETLRSLSSLLARSRRVNAENSALYSPAVDEALNAMPKSDYLSGLIADARQELQRFKDLSGQKQALGI